MRLLYLIDNFSLGGAQIVVKGLMENHAHSKDIYAVALRQKFPETPIDHPNAICFKSRSRYTFGPLKFLRKLIAKEQIEIIHCQLPRSIVFGYLLKRRFPGVKYIIHEQGDVFESRIYAVLLRMLHKRADGIVACSEATKNKLSVRSHITPHRTRVLYNFVDLSRFSPAVNPKGNGFRIAFAGRIEKRKGWREFVESAKHFGTNSGLSFHMAGSGKEEKLLIRRIHNQGNSNIGFIGFRASIETFYREMNLLIVPSHFEPMGMVAIEAMACGVPVLAADVPGLNEVVRHGINGWTYPPKSVTALTEAIKDILNCNPETISAIINRGLEHSREYSLQNYAGKLLDFYAELG